MGVRTQDVRVTIMLTRRSYVCHCSCCNSNCNKNKMSNLEFSRFRCSWVYYNPPVKLRYTLIKDTNIYSCDTSSENKDLQHCTGNIYWYNSLNSCGCFRFYQSIWIDYLFEVAMQMLIFSVFDDIVLLISREPHLGLISNFQGIFYFLSR